MSETGADIEVDLATVAGFVDAVLRRFLWTAIAALAVLLVSETARQHDGWFTIGAIALAVFWAARSDYTGGIDG